MSRPLIGVTTSEVRLTEHSDPLPEADPSLRPVTELRWERDGLHLRLTGQGPWTTDALLGIARSV